mmetsp:Transcript_34721/g.53291  ORF Transcript_34721/g.53291 Transcript_34721/m.53291 type:complete len:90 (+) Transcript_34721:2469-2738(+)
MSKSSSRSVKHINESLERVHTFSMANAHQQRREMEDLDKKWNKKLKESRKRSITKTNSLAKLKSVITESFKEPSRKEGGNRNTKDDEVD